MVFIKVGTHFKVIIIFNNMVKKELKHQEAPKTKGKPKSRKEEQVDTYPEYQNQDDIPVWEPGSVHLNKQKQFNIKKNKKQQVEEPQPQEEEEYDDDELIEQAEGIEEDDDEVMEEEDIEGEGEGQEFGGVEGGEGEEGEELEEVEFEDDGRVDEIIEDPYPTKGKNNDFSMINMKIQEILAVLSSFQKLAEPGKSRKQYLEELKGHLQSYYSYNSELIDHFLTFLNPNELIQFFEANETQRPLTIRVNTLKTRRKELAEALLQRGVDLDKLAEWSKVGIKIYKSKVPIGATPEYLAGHYMLQSASSFLPVIALDPKANQKILDLAAAPGGKTTYIAQMMKNTGVIFANDVKKERLRALQFNVQRLGISNVITTNYDGRKITKAINNFDRVLLDAPCTGLGIISKDHSIKANKVLMDIRKHSHLQKELILAAIDSAKANGVIVYSTCSVSPLENEEVVNYALKRRYVKLVDIPVDLGEPGYMKYVEKRYHPDLVKTRRIYPHVHNMDGFFVAKLVKISNGKKVVQEHEDEEDVVKTQEPVEEEEKVTTTQSTITKKIKKAKKTETKKAEVTESKVQVNDRKSEIKGKRAEPKVKKQKP